MTAKDELIRADESYKTGMELFNDCKLRDAKGAFRTAYQLYRKYDKHGDKISEAASFLALCIVESSNSHDELIEAEDLLIHFARVNETIAEKIPRAFILGKAYTLLGRAKFMRLVCSERIALAAHDDERAFALAGAVYAAIPGTTDAYHYAKDALPLLQAIDSHSEALAIVLEAMSRAVECLSSLDRLTYAEELLELLKELPPHPMIPSLYEVYMLLSYIYIEQTQWHEALKHAKLALNSAAVNANKQEVASTYMHIAKIYEMMDEPREATKARFKALKTGVSFYGSDLLAYAKDLSVVARQLSHYCEYRLSVSAQLLSLRCLVDSGDSTYDQIRESVIILQNYEHNLI